MTRRPRHPVPAFVRRALARRRLLEAYRDRPPYQRNDYLAWILRAKTDETQLRRLEQMLNELKKGDVYMKMTYRPGRRRP